jgi:hypothetical protein
MDVTLAKAIEEDLFNELRWLLCAATEWDAHNRLIGEPPQKPIVAEPCCHLKVYAMDSAFAHARSLYEFFTTPEKTVLRNEERRFNRLTWRDYSVNAVQESGPYDGLRGPLHGRVMHVCKDRSGYEQIKKEVVTLAADILGLWERFSQLPDLREYASLLDKCRIQAIEEAESVANQYKAHGYRCPFSEPTPGNVGPR